MSDANKEVIYHKDGFVIIKDSDLDIQPIDCPVCWRRRFLEEWIQVARD